jgi:hypothetical protein
LAALPLLALAACRPEPPAPPDPDEITPALACDESAPISLTRTTADSALATPPWLQACTLCPPAGADWLIEDGAEGELERFAAWGPGPSCAVALPTAPPPAVPAVAFSLAVDAPSGSGTWSGSLALPGGRGANPPDLEGATWVLSAGPARLPALPPAWLESPTLLLAHAAGAWSLARTLPGSDVQDPCVAPWSLAVGAPIDLRHGAAPIASGAVLPGGSTAAAGGFSTRVGEFGDALADIVLIASIDLAQSEAATGLPASELCDSLTVDGMPSCVPCTDPALGLGGLPTCMLAAWEWPAAPRASAPLVPFDASACPDPPDP